MKTNKQPIQEEQPVNKTEKELSLNESYIEWVKFHGYPSDPDYDRGLHAHAYTHRNKYHYLSDFENLVQEQPVQQEAKQAKFKEGDKVEFQPTRNSGWERGIIMPSDGIQSFEKGYYEISTETGMTCYMPESELYSLQQEPTIEQEERERPSITDYFEDMNQAHHNYLASPRLFAYVQALDRYIDTLTSQEPLREKPLSEITDEDAIEVANILMGKRGFNSITRSDVCIDIKSKEHWCRIYFDFGFSLMTIDYPGQNFNDAPYYLGVETIYIIKAYQYLKSRGYKI